MQIDTHLGIHRGLCGEPTALSEGSATVQLTTVPDMGADDAGLVHGGFVFGAADYAAMLAVNHPYVVLGGADVRFIAPVKVGDVVEAVATLTEEKGKKRVLDVTAKVGDKEVFRGTFTAFVLEKHVLDA